MHRMRSGSAACFWGLLMKKLYPNSNTHGEDSEEELVARKGRHVWEELCSRWGALGGSREENEQSRTSNPLGMRAKPAAGTGGQNHWSLGLTASRKTRRQTGADGGGEWVGSLGRRGQHSPRELPACVIAMVGGGPLRDGVGEGRQYVREGWVQRCTLKVPVVTFYTPQGRLDKSAFQLNLGSPLTQQSWEKMLL